MMIHELRLSVEAFTHVAPTIQPLRFGVILPFPVVLRREVLYPLEAVGQDWDGTVKPIEELK